LFDAGSLEGCSEAPAGCYQFAIGSRPRAHAIVEKQILTIVFLEISEEVEQGFPHRPGCGA
jgi:hypothetical protein